MNTKKTKISLSWPLYRNPFPSAFFHSFKCMTTLIYRKLKTYLPCMLLMLLVDVSNEIPYMYMCVPSSYVQCAMYNRILYKIQFSIGFKSDSV